MKMIIKSLVGLFVFGASLVFFTGCGQHGHKGEERRIQQERRREEKATADLGNAIKATDTIGWDAAGMHKKFSDTIKLHLAKNKQALNDFKVKVSLGHKTVPLRYRRRIRTLMQRSDKLAQRLALCHIDDKARWEDFTTLYRYDLQRLEQDIHKLVGH